MPGAILASLEVSRMAPWRSHLVPVLVAAAVFVVLFAVMRRYG